MGTPGGLMPSPGQFKKHGQCGMDVSELFPHVAKNADDIALIRSMYCAQQRPWPGAVSDEHRHHSGRTSERGQLGHLRSRERRIRTCPASSSSPIGAAVRSAARRTGATASCPRPIRARRSARSGDPIVDLKPPAELTPERAAAWLDLLGKLNEEHLAKNPGGHRAFGAHPVL